MTRFGTSETSETVPGTPWSITDTVLDAIDRELAVPTPERGAALIAVRDSRMIIDLVVDPRPGERVSYWHSDQLRSQLGEYLAGHPLHRYVGTVHSHPGGYAEPSGPDHQAFVNMLAANPSIRDSIFPIVVQKHRAALGDVLRLGEGHLIDLPGGTFAGYSAHPTEADLLVRPAPMHVIPARAHAELVADALSNNASRVTAEGSSPLTIGGTIWLAVHFKLDGRTVAGAALGPSYPITPPMIWTSASAAPRFPSWPVNATGHDLVGAITALMPHAAADHLPAMPSVIRAGIEERLKVHLPNRIETQVLLIGAGSVGSNAAEMLVRSGVHKLTIVDYDTVEPANLSRTVYASGDIGELKTTALRQRLRSIAPDVEITLITSPLQELTADILDAADVAFLASDDMAGEGWLNHEFYSRQIPIISVKVFAGAEGAELAYVVPARDTACLRCMMGTLGSGDRGDVDYGTGRINGSPALGPDIIAAVARGVKIALALTQADGPLADWLDSLVQRRLTYFLASNVHGWKYTEFARAGSLPFDGMWLTAPGRPDCEICGSERISDTQPAVVAAFTAEPPPDASDA